MSLFVQVQEVSIKKDQICVVIPEGELELCIQLINGEEHSFEFSQADQLDKVVKDITSAC